MIDKNIANVIAVGGVVLMGIGTLIYYGISGYLLDVELMKQLFAGLLGFAGGAGSGVIVANALNNANKNDKNDSKDNE